LLDLTSQFNDLGKHIYNLCADTVVSMRELQLGVVKIAHNVIRREEFKDFDEQRWATCFMTMRIPHN